MSRKGGWGADYYRLGSLTLELADCCSQLGTSVWTVFSRERDQQATGSLDFLDARWAAAHIKLMSGSLSEAEINALILTFGGVARVLRKRSTSTDFDAYVGQLRARVDYFREHGIDAGSVGNKFSRECPAQAHAFRRRTEFSKFRLRFSIVEGAPAELLWGPDDCRVLGGVGNDAECIYVVGVVDLLVTAPSIVFVPADLHIAEADFVWRDCRPTTPRASMPPTS